MASPRSTMLSSDTSSPRKLKQDIPLNTAIPSTRLVQAQTQKIQQKFVRRTPKYKPPPINNSTKDSITDTEDTSVTDFSSRHNSRQADFLTLPLDCLSKRDIKESLKNSKVPLKYGYSDFDDEDDSKEEEEQQQMSTVIGPDRARFNLWNGTNYDLHVLGDFKSEFEKKVKSFQRPDTVWISMDPFCRTDIEEQDEPGNAEAFLLWKTTSTNWESERQDEQHKDKPKQTQSITNANPYDQDNSTEGDDSSSGESIVKSSCSATSLPNVEIKSYVRCKKKNRKQGLDVTGENIYYDDEYDVIRNLHRDSYSLTNYGTLPDEKYFGKAYVFYPEMTTDEKKMLQPIERKDTLSKKKSSKTISNAPLQTIAIVGNDIKFNYERKDRNDSGDFLSLPLKN